MSSHFPLFVLVFGMYSMSLWHLLGTHKADRGCPRAGELRQLVRECENLEAVASPRAVARVAELSPLLSQPGGRKRGVLLSPSRSPIPRGHVLDDISADQGVALATYTLCHLFG